MAIQSRLDSMPTATVAFDDSITCNANDSTLNHAKSIAVVSHQHDQHRSETSMVSSSTSHEPKKLKRKTQHPIESKSKRQRRHTQRQQHRLDNDDDDEMDNDAPLPVSSHPLIQPEGNRLLASSSQPTALCALTNSPFAIFTRHKRQEIDELILEEIMSFLSPIDIARSLRPVCRQFYVYSHAEIHWRNATFRQFNNPTFSNDDSNCFQFNTNWQLTYIKAYLQSRIQSSPMPSIPSHLPSIRIRSFYSDYLFHQHYCTNVDLSNSRFNRFDNILRINAAQLSNESFQQHFANTNRPVIIQGLVNKWPIFNMLKKSSASSSTDSSASTAESDFMSTYGSTVLSCGSNSMSIRQYMQYANQVSSSDEVPPYLFDSRYCEKMDASAANAIAARQHSDSSTFTQQAATFQPIESQFTVPSYFKHDFFSLLDELDELTNNDELSAYNDGTESRCASDPFVNRSRRPAYRWILCGATRTGSTFHKDPNATSAWNALLTGRKKWILYPPNHTPPGVHSIDSARSIVTPVSVSEWFVKHYQDHVDVMKQFAKVNASNRPFVDDTTSVPFDVSQPTVTDYSSYGPIECVCEPGDCLFIPSQWFHTALNFDTSIALTANHVQTSNLLDSIDFMTSDGNHELRDLLVQQVNRHHSGLINRLREFKQTSTVNSNSKQAKFKQQQSTSNSATLKTSQVAHVIDSQPVSFAFTDAELDQASE